MPPPATTSTTPTTLLTAIDIVAALDIENGIGTGTAMPWHLKADLKWFATLTTTHSNKTDDKWLAKKSIHAAKATIPSSSPPPPLRPHTGVIMGRKTWEALPSQYQPLPHRINIILSKQERHKYLTTSALTHKNVKTYTTLEQALTYASIELKRLFVIGGRRLYQQFLTPPLNTELRYLYITHIAKNFNCKVKFPNFLDLVASEKLSLIKEKEKDLAYEIIRYRMKKACTKN
ncbi:dihydrofolate reductase [Spirochaetota bacterium]|nr:dihydrofolate reductase [Spirochaetota bacterium]